jgi:hypothetical protein
MGRGPTIQELAEEDQKFREYLAQIRQELEKDKQKDLQNLEAEVKNYYDRGGWNDYKPLLLGDKLDVQQVSVWSLENVGKILNAIQGAIFGGSEPPDGITVEKPKEFNQSLKFLTELNLLALSRAFSAVQGILETFATETSYKGQSILKTEVIAPGMTLFVSIRSDVYRTKGFFNNSSIAQYLYLFRSYFSVKQAGDLSKFNDLLAYEELKSAYRTRMSALAEKIANPSTPFSAMAELEEEAGYYASQLSAIQAKINALQEKEIERFKQRIQSGLAARRSSLAA